MTKKFILKQDHLEFLTKNSNQYSASQLTKILGCSFSTVQRLCFDHNFKLRTAPLNSHNRRPQSKDDSEYLQKRYDELLRKNIIK
ncbi:hypothetical protein [Piscirickettsia salmonis]|uniref:hypothetical protein n=1 Tax=Piscirickettsia salmonis TaxID=1238 RepID=UPI0012BA6086|nr:hypothetical protein [Piscirickettsia salmonis]QGP41359.1 hypothetical protein Psal182_03569 [Piscirickettsia salmonis]QGP57112.1 hypothetical protein PsalSR1_04601 [Piscirickettsia salmonis]QGP61906.1 hypothetical protein PsalBI1_04548 [Piscirickettsia salmonis]